MWLIHPCSAWLLWMFLSLLTCSDLLLLSKKVIIKNIKNCSNQRRLTSRWTYCVNVVWVLTVLISNNFIAGINIVLQFDEHIAWTFTEANWRCIDCQYFQFHKIIIVWLILKRINLVLIIFPNQIHILSHRYWLILYNIIIIIIVIL